MGTTHSSTRQSICQVPSDTIHQRSDGPLVYQLLRVESDCPELVSRLVRLFVPDVPKLALRPRRRVLAVPAAQTVSRRNSPLPRALSLLNALLASAPECDLIALRWASVRNKCLRFCEVMDARPSSVILFYFVYTVIISYFIMCYC